LHHTFFLLVGENTFPNAVSSLTGYSMQDLEKFCYNRNRPVDYCPFIWKEFDRANYVTAFLEDVVKIATFNYFKLGFLNPPCDYYARPLNIGLRERGTSFFFPDVSVYTTSQYDKLLFVKNFVLYAYWLVEFVFIIRNRELNASDLCIQKLFTTNILVNCIVLQRIKRCQHLYTCGMPVCPMTLLDCPLKRICCTPRFSKLLISATR